LFFLKVRPFSRKVSQLFFKVSALFFKNALAQLTHLAHFAGMGD
jgi:hypothetical protein